VWSDAALEATGLSEARMPALFEGSDAAGGLRPELAARWGMRPGTPIAGGAGDQAAGAAGVGVVDPGDAFLALGTSGVFFVAGAAFAPNPSEAVHAFCHCLPGRWHQMSVILSAASCLSWIAALTGARDEASLLAEVEAAQPGSAPPIFLPYLSGERTPHNDPHAKGVFFGLSHQHRRADLAQAVLEGVAFALADGQAALTAAGTAIGAVCVIGGGARSRLWGEILASVLGRSLRYPEEADVGPAFGAARLGRLAVTGEDVAGVCVAPPIRDLVEPDPGREAILADRYGLYRRLYESLKASFPELEGRAV
jgi:xylulokinase